MSNEKLFCPEFVYEICVGLTVYDFVFKDLTLSMNAKQYSTALSDHYKDVHEDEMACLQRKLLDLFQSKKTQNMKHMKKLISLSTID